MEHVGHRADLGYIIAMVGGEIGVGHSYLTGAGDVPAEDPVSVGLLGADYEIDKGYYRIKRISTRARTGTRNRAPLSAPGVQVSEGDYIVGKRPHTHGLDKHLQSVRRHGGTTDAYQSE